MIFGHFLSLQCSFFTIGSCWLTHSICYSASSQDSFHSLEPLSSSSMTLHSSPTDSSRSWQSMPFSKQFSCYSAILSTKTFASYSTSSCPLRASLWLWAKSYQFPPSLTSLSSPDSPENWVRPPWLRHRLRAAARWYWWQWWFRGRNARRSWEISEKGLLGGVGVEGLVTSQATTSVKSMMATHENSLASAPAPQVSY